MTEQPIERLNYFNGQRLEAADFRLEQEYHVRTQRWLSKSLFSPGVGDGLLVYITHEGKRVLVTPGLALDDLGRAIILTSPAELLPQARFLCARYAEHKQRVQEQECRVRGAERGALAHAAGPERIVSEAELVWRSSAPQNDAREIIIAELDLASDCTVTRIVSGAKRFAVASQVSRVFSYALEGEKDIAAGNSKLLRFHINGRTPNAVWLSLKARHFSILHYTELAPHVHGSTIATSDKSADGKTSTTDVATGIDQHGHSNGTLTAHHGHDVKAMIHGKVDVQKDDQDHPDQVTGVELQPNQYLQVATGVPVGELITEGLFVPLGFIDAIFKLIEGTQFADAFVTSDRSDPNGHFPIGIVDESAAVTGSTGVLDLGVNPTPEEPLHTHALNFEITNPSTGQEGPDAKLRAGAQYDYFYGLKVRIDNSDPVETTRAILRQLAEGSDIWANRNLDGGPDDPLSDGTPLIRLDLLGVDGVAFGPGAHEIEFSVDASGGQLLYNLYIE